MSLKEFTNLNLFYSSKRIEAFLDEIFDDQENIKTSRFLTKFNLLQNCVIDNIVDGKFKPMAETLVPQFTVEVGAAEGITDTTGVEPDATKKGAFFFVGIVSDFLSRKAPSIK